MPPLAHDRYFCFPTSGYISDAYITKGCLSNDSECKEIEGEKVINLLSSQLLLVNVTKDTMNIRFFDSVLF